MDEYLGFDPGVLRRKVGLRDQGRCAKCSKVAVQWDADHVIPLVEGGPNTLENLRTLCRPCHKEETKALAGRRAERRKAEKAKKE